MESELRAFAQQMQELEDTVSSFGDEEHPEEEALAATLDVIDKIMAGNYAYLEPVEAYPAKKKKRAPTESLPVPVSDRVEPWQLLPNEFVDLATFDRMVQWQTNTVDYLKLGTWMLDSNYDPKEGGHVVYELMNIPTQSVRLPDSPDVDDYIVAGNIAENYEDGDPVPTVWVYTEDGKTYEVFRGIAVIMASQNVRMPFVKAWVATIDKDGRVLTYERWIEQAIADGKPVSDDVRIVLEQVDKTIKYQPPTPAEEPTEIIAVAQRATREVIDDSIPWLFQQLTWEAGTVNVDIGGGPSDAGTEYLATIGVTNFVLDPVNRSEEHNVDVINRLRREPADTATIRNLDKITDWDLRQDTIATAVSLVKPGGAIALTTTDGVIRGYLTDIRLVLPTAVARKNVITAMTPDDVDPGEVTLPTKTLGEWMSIGAFPGIVTDPGLARSTICTRITIEGHEPLVYSSGIVGALNPEQVALYCADGIVEEAISPDQHDKLKAMLEASDRCSLEIQNEQDPNKRLEMYFSCVQRELEGLA